MLYPSQNSNNPPLVALSAGYGLSDAIVFYRLASQLQRAGIRSRLYCNYLHELKPLIIENQDLEIDLLCHAPFFSIPQEHLQEHLQEGNQSHAKEKIEIHQVSSCPAEERKERQSLKRGYVQQELSLSQSFPPIQKVRFSLFAEEQSWKQSWDQVIDRFLWNEFSISMRPQPMLKPDTNWSKAPKQVALCPYNSSFSHDCTLFKKIACVLQNKGYNPLFFVPSTHIEEAKSDFAGFSVAAVTLAQLCEFLYSSTSVITSSKAVALLAESLQENILCIQECKKDKAKWLEGKNILCHVSCRRYTCWQYYCSYEAMARYLIYKAGL